MYLLISNFSFYLSILIFITSISLIYFDLRKKFILFILTVILFCMLGFLFDLDGIFLIFLVAELTIFLLLLMTYTQLYNNYRFITSQSISYYTLLLLIIFLQYTPYSTFYSYTTYYNTLNNIVSGDFYILYYLLFEQLPVITLIVVLIITFFSLFFIIMYFSLKLVKNFSLKKIKNIYFLRKQVLTKQTKFLNKIYTFQN